ncbi:MAG: efflux RND transporter periplasmic adaptor subunit [Deltaproteobacteria bacterium]|nr:efflux RND transporter periplasmic adaptor subunit [Deltaproteobacteria bacterium]
MGFRSIVHGWGIVAACAVAACEGDFTAVFSSPDRNPVPVHVETVSSERSPPALVIPGVVEAKSTRTLGFRASGRIARFHVEQGARVAAGDAIAEFDLAQLEAEQRSARTNLVRAQARRLEAARREGGHRHLLELAAVASAPVASPSIELLLHEAEVRYAQALVERSRSRLAAGVLRAPANGIVDRRYRGIGEAVLAGAPVVRLTELDIVVTRASLPRALQPLLRVGGSADVRLGEEAAAPLSGVIVSVGGGSVAATSELEFEIRVENPLLALRPGMLVAITIPVEGPDALYTIPLAAVRRGIDERPFTFVVVGRGAQLQVERRRLVFGGLNGDRVAVVDGLAVGDRVVTHGQDLVTVGDAVGIVGEGL